MAASHASRPMRRVRRRTYAAAVIAVGCALCASAHAGGGDAAPPDAEHGKILYLKYCTPCHGPHAFGDGPRAIPALAGQREAYIGEQLAAFAATTRAGESMHEMMRHTDLNRPPAIADLAAYLSQLPRGRSPEQGRAHDLGTAGAYYQKGCSGCHGADGSGQPAGIPVIGGQQYRYLLARLSDFTATHRERVALPPGAPVQLEELAEYVARLGLPASGSEAR